MKTFLRRWYVCNRLYHLLRRRGGRRWVPEHDLCAWIAGLDIENARVIDASGNWIPDPRPFHFHWPLNHFFDATDHDQLYMEVRNILQECADPDVGWIERQSDSNGISPSIRLTARGREIYAVSYLIFGTDYAKTIWTGVIVAVVGAFLIDKLQGAAHPHHWHQV